MLGNWTMCGVPNRYHIIITAWLALYRHIPTVRNVCDTHPIALPFQAQYAHRIVGVNSLVDPGNSKH